jgi:hypothetical protein
LGAALQADGETGSRFGGVKHQKEKRSKDHFAGLDVSVKQTSVCIVDDAGKIVRELKVASEPDALLAALKNPLYRTTAGCPAGATRTDCHPASPFIGHCPG